MNYLRPVFYQQFEKNLELKMDMAIFFIEMVYN